MIALSIIVLATFTQALISSCTLHVDNLLQAVAGNKENGAVILSYHMGSG